MSLVRTKRIPQLAQIVVRHTQTHTNECLCIFHAFSPHFVQQTEAEPSERDSGVTSVSPFDSVLCVWNISTVFTKHFVCVFASHFFRFFFFFINVVYTRAIWEILQYL